MVRAATLFSVLAIPLPAFGQTVAFDLDDARAQELGLDAEALEGDLADGVETELQLVDPEQYLDGFARAAAIAVKGIGVDYASNAKAFVVGATFGTAVSGVPLSFTRGPDELPEGGFAFMASLHAGLNLGAFSKGEDKLLDRFRIFASGLGFRTPSDREFRGRMANVGVHGQISVPAPVGVGPMEWGGVSFTFGYERSLYELELSRSLPLSFDTGEAVVTWHADGTYTITTTADTLPIELSTNFRLAFFTVFGGAGIDFDAAHTTSSISLDGPVEAAVGGASEEIGDGVVLLDGDGNGLPTSVRGFAGLQLAVFAFKMYGQLNFGPDNTYGGFVGVRVAQ